MQKFKVGDKVMWLGNPKNIGTVIDTDRGDGYCTVKWQDIRESLSYNADCPQLSKVSDDQLKLLEQQAVELLLSLGYTISKQPMVTNISNKT